MNNLNMSSKDIDGLLALITSKGVNYTYDIIEKNAYLSIDKNNKNLDNYLLNVSEQLLEKGRQCLENDSQSLNIKLYYTLSYMFRKIAHKIYRKYDNGNKKSDRFLYIAYSNTNTLNMVV